MSQNTGGGSLVLQNFLKGSDVNEETRNVILGMFKGNSSVSDESGKKVCNIQNIASILTSLVALVSVIIVCFTIFHSYKKMQEDISQLRLDYDISECKLEIHKDCHNKECKDFEKEIRECSQRRKSK